MATISQDSNKFVTQPVIAQSVATGMDAETSRARNSITDESRESASGRHILQLPNEVLAAIFQHESGKKTIQNARLTCRRFRETSSEFLITTVSVELSHDSLAEFCQILSHPIFGKGVATVHVQLAMYDEGPIKSLSHFRRHHNNRLIESYHTLMNPSGHKNTPEHSKLRSILDSWRVMYGRRPNENDVYLVGKSDRFRNLIVRAFRESQRLRDEQRELLESGAFVAQIVSAIEVKPKVRRLVFGDQDHRLSTRHNHWEWLAPEDQLADDEKLCKTLCNNVRVSYWYREEQEGWQREAPLPPDAVPIIPGLLAALGAAGSRITSLDINISYVSDFARLRPATEHDQANIRSAIGDLNELQICSGHEAYLPRSRDEHQVVTDFVTQLINVHKLESVFMRLRSWSRDIDPMFMDTVSMPSIDLLKPQTIWCKLQNVALYDLALRCPDLERLLRFTKSSKLSTTVWLCRIHLLGGSWVSTVDILKERHSSAHLIAPSGGECERMDFPEYRTKFGSYYQDEDAPDENTEVARYIRGIVAVNPLLPLPELEPNA